MIGSWKSCSVNPFEWCQPFSALAMYLADEVVRQVAVDALGDRVVRSSSARNRIATA